jgi:hypothetical protein
MANQKTLNLKEFKGLVQKLIKEEIQKDAVEKVKLQESIKLTKKKLVVLEHRKNAVDKILKEASWFDKLRGTVDPSKEVDDPTYIRKNIDSALAKADKISNVFSDKVLANTSAINSYHQAVSDVLDKLSLLDGSPVGEALKSEYENKIINAAKTFYKIMSDEKGRIESYTKTLINDLQSKGIDKSYLTIDKKPKKMSEPSFKVMTPKEMSDKQMVDKVLSGEKDVSSIK